MGIKEKEQENRNKDTKRIEKKKKGGASVF